MKNLFKKLFLSTILFAVAGAGFAFASTSKSVDVQAASTGTFPRSGSGTLMFVNGNGHFKQGEADLAIYCFNSTSDNAWSDRSSYRVSGDTIRIMVPYQGGIQKQWAKFIVCRYNPNMNPQTDGWAGVYNQSADLEFSGFIQDQNTVTVTGYDGDKLAIATMRSVTTYYGINPKIHRHMYLDLSGFQGWEDGGAKFAIYFGGRHFTNETSWGLSNSVDGFYQSFCWKVNGQDNDHLYECMVPGPDTTVWNMVIAVRINPEATGPNFDQKWNQTQDLKFVADNQNANMIRITDWNSGEIDSVNIISRESRVSFYGKYFTDTVACSGSGDSDATTSEMWDKVKWEYINHLHTELQGDVWTTTADKGGNAIEQAMARYDYITLYKKYSHEDFINRAESPNKTYYQITPVVPEADNNISIVVIVMVAAVSLIGVSTLLVIKKTRRR